MDHHKMHTMYRTNKREPFLQKLTKLYMVKTFFYIIIISTTFSFLFLPHIVRYSNKIAYFPHKYMRYIPDIKYVLIWKEHREEKPLVIGQKMFIEQKCPHINCYFTYNKSLLDDNIINFDAVVFNVQDVRKLPANKLTLMRSPHQKYIFRSLQPAAKYTLCSDHFEGFFNLTWTYKLDSDIPQPFINVYNAMNNIVGPKVYVEWQKVLKHNAQISKKIKSKTKAVSWILSKCSSKNKQHDFVNALIQELKGYNITVDDYGACASNKCPEGNLWQCYKMIERDYFFNLVLEDYLTVDYFTESIVKTMTHNTLPIVSAGANFDRFLPPGSYVNVKEHDLKSLAAIIDYLIKHPIEYGRFFDWKNHYYLTENPVNQVCGLCAKLNENVVPKPAYTNFRWWWNSEFDLLCKPWYSNYTDE